MVVYACNPTTWKAEAGGLPGAQVYCQPVVNFRPSKGFVWHDTKEPSWWARKIVLWQNQCETTLFNIRSIIKYIFPFFLLISMFTTQPILETKFRSRLYQLTDLFSYQWQRMTLTPAYLVTVIWDRAKENFSTVISDTHKNSPKAQTSCSFIKRLPAAFADLA